MQMKSPTFLLLAISLSIGLVHSPIFAGTMVSFQSPNFERDSTVLLTPDGFGASFTEDSVLGVVSLFNDPFFTAPTLFTSASGFISLDYSFNLASGESDEFGVVLLDSLGNTLDDFFTTSTSTGSITFDVSSYTTEPYLALYISLASLPGDNDFGSTASVSNLMVGSSGSVVPEPTSCACFLGTISCMAFGYRRRRSTAAT